MSPFAMTGRRVLFIADQFSDAPRTSEEKHPGGAELTDAAAIEACPWTVETAKTGELSARDLVGFDVHIIANCRSAAPELIAELARLGRHVLFEHDVRICMHNGNYPAGINAVHETWHRCVCPFPHLWKLIRGARGMIFLTHRQLAHYQRNPFFRPPKVEVLGGSLMNRMFFERVARYRARRPEKTIDTAIAYSVHRIKGYEPAFLYCERRGIEPHVIRDLTPEQVLDTFERTARFVYLPFGLEPAGRLLVEARMLGCEIISNENAGVCGEPWWGLSDELALESLRDGPARFWRLVEDCVREPHRIVPARSDAMALRRGPEWTYKFNEWVFKVERKLLPKRLVARGNRQRDARCMNGEVLTRPPQRS